MYGCESWTIKKAECRGTDAFELWCWRRRKSPLDCKENKPINTKGNQLWIFIGRTDAEAEAPILWPPDVKSWRIRKDPEAGRDWRQEEKVTTQGDTVGWHHSWLNGHELEQDLGDGEGQGSLGCCSPWDCKESDLTERLNDSNSRMLSWEIPWTEEPGGLQSMKLQTLKHHWKSELIHCNLWDS